MGDLECLRMGLAGLLKVYIPDIALGNLTLLESGGPAYNWNFARQGW